ncbi:MAG: hypothetical protein ACHQNV_02590 [Vicinamibacteria bacterium]
MREAWDKLGRFVRRKTVAWTLVALAVIGVGGLTYMKLVEKGIFRYNRYDRREKGTLLAGHQAPDLTLKMYDGSDVRLSTLWKTKPVMLIFGSCT